MLKTVSVKCRQVPAIGEMVPVVDKMRPGVKDHFRVKHYLYEGSGQLDFDGNLFYVGKGTFNGKRAMIYVTVPFAPASNTGVTG